MLRGTRWWIVPGVLLSLALVFAAACGGGDDDDDSSGGETPAAGETPGSGDEGEYAFVLTEAPSDAAPPEDQKLVVNLQGEPGSLDPQGANFAPSISVLHQLFAGLLTYDDDVNVVPLLATEVPSVANGGISSDGLTYTFHVKTGTKWSDGKPVTANDFEYAIKRLFDPTVGVYYAGFFTDIVGAADTYAATEATPEEIAQLTEAIGVTAIDDATLEIKLVQPVATFLQRMSMHAVFPVRQDVVEANPDDWTEPENIVTNGPYTLSEWAHQDHITLQANPDFFLGEPVLQEITFKMQPDANVAFAEYQTGDYSTTGVPESAVQQVENTLADELHEGNTLLTFALDFNHAAPPFDDLNVRKAFAAAMDRDAYVVGVLQGVGVPAITWLPPGIPGNDPEVGIPFDADQARQYLADSEKYPNGEGIPTITYRTADSSSNQLIAEYVKAQASDVLGIDVEIEIMESAAFEAAHDAGDYQLAFTGWGADYPDPDNWLPQQFGTDGPLNTYNYSNADADALFAQAAVELDNDARIALYEQAQKIVIQDDPAVVPLVHDAVFHLVKPNVKGWRLNPLDAQIPGDYGYARVYISN